MTSGARVWAEEGCPLPKAVRDVSQDMTLAAHDVLIERRGRSRQRDGSRSMTTSTTAENLKKRQHATPSTREATSGRAEYQTRIYGSGTTRGGSPAHHAKTGQSYRVASGSD
jgi:hypothetical protein